MREILFGCDMDGTTFDQLPAFLPHYNFYNKDITSVEQIKYYNPKDLGFPLKEFKKMLKNFEYTGEFRNMLPIPGAIESVNKFYDVGGKVFYITARNAYPTVYDDSLESLVKNRAKFEKLIIAHPPKLDKIRELGIVGMAEDDPETIEFLGNNEVYTICVNRPYNQEVQETDFIKRCEANQIFECFMDNYRDIL